jgi:hypothetical protein
MLAVFVVVVQVVLILNFVVIKETVVVQIMDVARNNLTTDF